MVKILKKDINLYDTLFSGQCFRMFLESDNSYTVILRDRVVNIKEDDKYLLVTSNNENNLEEVISNYLDLYTDYQEINDYLVSKNHLLEEDICKCCGYKILRQDRFEMYITYIISQNNNVKRIIGSVNKLSEAYGKKVIFRNKEYYLFPTFQSIKDLNENDFRNFGVGFRDIYIVNALNKLKEEPNFLDKLDSLSTKDALDELIKIKGVGTKVASCILLFGYSRFDTFPIDTWVRKYVSNNFNVKDDIKSISEYMLNTFGKYCGLVIQYFYHVERNKKH